ncbi:4850_t:CDS:2 [Dentiscutata erythropus]|uniref:4850_t:CDS:1 n=1 Tax=Dentiscutata erythropus TaxID=1348616 RepID=A0A9N9IYY6_9GLOM|nr:4850_t:CDS:2 [Dentiscutata erythropus]
MISSEERIVLNVGGVKYETYRSTLTAYPNTLLGAMFHERNQELLRPTNGNEYFFDRNSRAFHYILEFYRTGKILLLDEITGPKESTMDVNIQELIEEIKYFQIPLPRRDIPTDQYHAVLLDKFIDALKDGICEARYDFHNIFGAEFAPINAGKKIFVTMPPEGNFKRLFEPFRYNGHKIIELFGDDIEEHIKSLFPDIKFSIIEGEVEENDVGYRVYVVKIEIGDEAWNRDAILGKSCLKKKQPNVS